MIEVVAGMLAVAFEVALDEKNIQGYSAEATRDDLRDGDSEWVVKIIYDGWTTTHYIPSSVIKQAMDIERREYKKILSDRLEGLI